MIPCIQESGWSHGGSITVSRPRGGFCGLLVFVVSRMMSLSLLPLPLTFQLQKLSTQSELYSIIRQGQCFIKSAGLTGVCSLRSPVKIGFSPSPFFFHFSCSSNVEQAPLMVLLPRLSIVSALSLIRNGGTICSLTFSVCFHLHPCFCLQA